MPRIETSSADAAAIAQYGPEHMRAIAAGLAERGLTAHLTDHRVGLDLTATLSPARLRGTEFWIDLWTATRNCVSGTRLAPRQPRSRQPRCVPWTPSPALPPGTAST